ncbi:MAG: hypothetical protein ACO1NN_09485 [Sphingopyxis sp.]
MPTMHILSTTMSPADTFSLDTLLLVAILVALLAQIALHLRGGGDRDAARHNRRLAGALDSDDFAVNLRHSALLEATLMAEIEAELESLRGLDAAGLERALADTGVAATPRRLAALRRIFGGDKVKELGSKLFDKMLGLFNKLVGLG